MGLKTQERKKLQPFKIQSGSAKGGGFVCLEAHNYRKEKLQAFSPRYHFQDRKTKRVEEAHKLVSRNGPGNHTPPSRETFVKECPSLARQSTWNANKSTDIQDQHLRLSQQHIICELREPFRLVSTPQNLLAQLQVLFLPSPHWRSTPAYTLLTLISMLWHTCTHTHTRTHYTDTCAHIHAH